MVIHRDRTAQLEYFRARFDAPAAAAAVIAADGPVWMGVAGMRVRGGSEPAALEDHWHLGSCGKSMTAALVGGLVESGSISWSTAVPELFDRLPVHANWGSVTLAALLTHRSGLRANLTRSEARAGQHDVRPPVEQRRELAARLLARPPGATGRFRYSNLGYSLVGAALEHLTGRTYEAMLFEDLLEPLGIEEGGFGAPHSLWGHRPRAAGFGKGPAVAPSDGLPHPSDNAAVITPAGRLHLRLADWGNFVRLFLLPGVGLLRATTIETLVTPTTSRGKNQAMGWAFAKLPGVSIGQQGSNRRWVATALLSEDRGQAALVVANDGRTRVLLGSAVLASELLTR